MNKQVSGMKSVQLLVASLFQPLFLAQSWCEPDGIQKLAHLCPFETHSDITVR